VGFQDFASSRHFSSELMCTDVEEQMIAMFAKMEHHTASDIRQQNMKRHSQHWPLIKTLRTCQFCLRRKPEHVLDCGHAICEACICIFGTPTEGREYCFEHKSCVLCQKRVYFQARLFPLTCRIRFISIDRGGSRAVVLLKYMDALQHVLNLPYPV
jgi:hypothetical protein